ncbi:MAG: amino acid permease [Gemmatimonadales bacterium]|nr:amino acid permease [Gemmatimonadales bacterium]
MSASEGQFVRGIGPWAAVSMVVGSMIGSGIFIVSADIGRQVDGWGPAGLLAVWVATGLVTMAGALSYCELAGLMPSAGGQYVFLREGLAPWAGFLYGWTFFTVIQTGTIAAVAVGFSKFLGVLLPGVTPDVWLSLGRLPMPGGEIEVGLSHQRLVGIASIVLLTWINIRGVALGARIQTVFTVAKMGGFAALIGLGLLVFRNADVWAGNAAGFWGTTPWTLAIVPVAGAAMVGSLFSSDAWNNVTFAAAEVRDPAKNLPRALALGTTFVTVLYLLANVAYLQVLPFAGDAAGVTPVARGIQHAAQDRVATAAFEAMIGPAGASVMAIAILISTFGCNAGLILAGARVYWAMANDNLFFRRAGELHPEYRTPAFGLVIQAGWASLLCLSGSYGQLLDYVIFAALLFYLLTTLALFNLRRTRPDAPRPVKAFGYPVVPGLYVVALAVLMVVLLVEKPLYTWPGLLIVALGVPVYLLWRRPAAA